MNASQSSNAAGGPAVMPAHQFAPVTGSDTISSSGLVSPGTLELPQLASQADPQHSNWHVDSYERVLQCVAIKQLRVPLIL